MRVEDHTDLGLSREASDKTLLGDTVVLACLALSRRAGAYLGRDDAPGDGGMGGAEVPTNIASYGSMSHLARRRGRSQATQDVEASPLMGLSS